MKFYADTIEVKVAKKKGTVNLNTHLNDALKKSGVRNGLIIVMMISGKESRRLGQMSD